MRRLRWIREKRGSGVRTENEGEIETRLEVDAAAMVARPNVVRRSRKKCVQLQHGRKCTITVMVPGELLNYIRGEMKMRIDTFWHTARFSERLAQQQLKRWIKKDSSLLITH